MVSRVAVLMVPAAVFVLFGGCRGVLTEANLPAEFQAWVSKPPSNPLSYLYFSVSPFPERPCSIVNQSRDAGQMAS